MMQPRLYRLFVYGSLRKGFQSPAYRYISDYFHFLSPARVEGELFDLGEFPAAVPGGSGHFIVGELYELKHEDEFGWAFAQLDDYEGVDAEEGQVPLYRREKVTVFTDAGLTEAWVYWYNAPVTGKPRIPSGDVLQYLQEKNRS